MCRKHYNELYNHIHPPVCSSCGARPKPGTPFTRHTPNADIISRLLTDTTEIDVSLKPTDCICCRYYTAHLSMMKDVQSSDEALQQDIQMWTIKHRDTTDTLTKSILRVVLLVADHLLQQKAVLLPHISQVFLEAYGVSPSSMADVNLDVGDSIVKFFSRWLLHQLVIYLHPYM